MKNIYNKYFRLILLMLYILCFIDSNAQQDYYEYHLEKGKNYFYSKLPDYVSALKEFDLAKNYISQIDTTRIDTINFWNFRTRNAIDTLYKSMKIATNEAKREQANANTARIQAENAKVEAVQALKKTTKIINAFYFYDEQFALAYKNNKYGFINKEGDIIIPYKYEDARPFDYTGLAWVKRNNQAYLLDSKKNEYELARGLNRITNSTTALDLSNLELVSFPENITDSTKLEILLLNNNEIKEVPDSINKLQQLKKLFIYDNYLSKLPNSIDSLSNLITLDASINRLVELPDSIGHLSNLEDLILYDNNLTYLPATIGGMQNLFFLDVSNNLLSALPDGIKSLDSLRILALGENQFKEFPPQLRSLKGLKMLDLSDNYIDKIPSWIENFDTLTHLYLWNDELISLPNEIINLDNLQVLIIGENKLKSLPSNLDLLTKLEELNLYGNQLETIPYELGKMKAIRKLDLGKNPDLDISQSLSVFKNSNKKIIVSAGGNDLDYLTGDQNLQIKFDNFESLPIELAQVENLFLLDIINCPDISAADIELVFNKDSGKVIYSSTVFPQVTDTSTLLINLDIKQFQKLEELDLSNINLSTVPTEVFSMPNLRNLNLNGNNLKKIPDEIIDLKNLKTLNLIGNPLQDGEIERIKSILPHCTVYYDNV